MLKIKNLFKRSTVFKKMARIPSVASLQRRTNELKAREAALKARQQAAPKVGTGQARPTQTAKYKSIFTTEDFTVNAPNAGITFFGGLGALGLAAPDTSQKLPRGFKAAKVTAVRGRSKGAEKTSSLSGRKYLKYSIDGSGGTQSTFSAPISADTVAALKTRFQSIITAKKDDIGEYGRISFEPERPIFSASGVSAGAGGA